MCPNYHSKFEEYHLLCDMPTPRDAVASKKFKVVTPGPFF